MQKGYSSIISVLTLAVAALFAVALYTSSRADDDYGCQTFTETAKMVCGKFLVFWQRHGGIRIFGYPISDSFQEKSDLDGKQYQVQYFERALFELHPENGPPNDVLLAQLGTMRLTNKYLNMGQRPWEPYVDNLPVYPGAKEVMVTRNQDGALVTTFQAKGNAEAIVNFYKGYMSRNRWELYNEAPGVVSFRYRDDRTNSLFFIGVEFSSSKLGETKVKLTLFRVPARDVPLAATPTSPLP